MKLKLENKHIVISGATGEIGRQICLDFALEGSIILPLYRSEEKKEKLLGWLRDNGINKNVVFPYKANLKSREDISTTVTKILREHKTIDVLVNCAGYAVEMPFLMLDDNQIEDQLNINYKAPIFLMKEILKPMFLNKGGSIINISSATASRFGRGVSVYGSAKAGLDRFTQIIAQEVGKKGIRVNSVSPGVIETEMSQDLIKRGKENIKEFTAMRRYGQTKDVSKAVLFLASDEVSGFITGHVMKVDGGIFL